MINHWFSGEQAHGPLMSSLVQQKLKLKPRMLSQICQQQTEILPIIAKIN